MSFIFSRSYLFLTILFLIVLCLIFFSFGYFFAEYNRIPQTKISDIIATARLNTEKTFALVYEKDITIGSYNNSFFVSKEKRKKECEIYYKRYLFYKYLVSQFRVLKNSQFSAYTTCYQ